MHIKNFDPYDFSKKEIEGVTVYYKNLPWAPCTHVRFLFSVGAFNDPVGKEGVAHFLEHILFDGFPLSPTKKEIEEFNKLYMLKSHNAGTSHNWTAYHGQFLPEHFKTVMKHLTDQISHPFIKTDDVEHERNVITQEAWGRYKNQKLLTYLKEFIKILYSKNQRGRIMSPLGWPDTVATIKQEDLQDFHKKYYVKENLSIFLVGAVEEKDLEDLPKIIKDIPNGEKAEINEGIIEKPLQNRIEKNSEEIGDPSEQLELTIVRVYETLSVEDRFAGYQATALLYDALFERLREENSICYGVKVNLNAYKNGSEITISVKTSTDKLTLAENEIWKVLEEIVSRKWKDRHTLIHKLKLDKIRSNETSSDSIISGSASEIINYNYIETVEEALERTGKVTYEDVINFTKKIFDKEYVLTEVIFPSKK